MKTIFITISRGSVIRNFFQTGVIKKVLDGGFRVIVLTPHYNEPEIFKDYQQENLILEPLIVPNNIKFKRLMYEIFTGIVFNATTRVRYKYSFCGKKPRTYLYLPRLILFASLGFIPGFKQFIRFIDAKINQQADHDYLFEKYKPDLVFITTAGDRTEAGLLKSARRFGVKKACMPKSWDNLSKNLFYSKADYMFVWGGFMKQQAIEFQDYKPDEIIITGAPQFDYYTRKENLLSREEFCRGLNLDPNKKIILYASNGISASGEAVYVSLIKKFIDERKLENVQVLIRPHLGWIGDEKKFDQIKGYEGFVVDNTHKQNLRFKDHWDISANHLKHLFNSFYHSDVCINIASTMTLDATACNRPAININFDVEKNLPMDKSVKRLYISDYFKAVIDFKVSQVVESEEEFLKALKEILEGEWEKPEKYQEFIEYFMHKTDGESAERIACNLIGLAKGEKICAR
ncbi:MAG: hypothetical protein UT31_C0018G0004 [Parcubacteria group bacterium GW2011_GWF2_39_13b]|nr:MAG: hypothetical protein UT31_C0018G0004 [Parcubacteria group bacterium GW2011_GWF2_39_13b]